jgi:hypothetical protein
MMDIAFSGAVPQKCGKIGLHCAPVYDTLSIGIRAYNNRCNCYIRGIWGGSDSSLHHNLFAHHSSRNPRFASKDKNIDCRNNVIYNWGFNSAYGGEGATVNMIANYYYKNDGTIHRPARDRLESISEIERHATVRN